MAIFQGNKIAQKWQFLRPVKKHKQGVNFVTVEPFPVA
jgi:hypothetical protein